MELDHVSSNSTGCNGNDHEGRLMKDMNYMTGLLVGAYRTKIEGKHGELTGCAIHRDRMGVHCRVMCCWRHRMA